MKKIIIILLSLGIIIFAIYAGNKIYEMQKNNETEPIKTTDLAETIEDDCTEEWKEIETLNQKDIQANSQENVRISPNCSIIYEIKYEKCGHVTKQYKNVTNDLVNKNEREINELYPEWTVKEFESNNVVLQKKADGECGEHYILRDVDGKIVVNLLDENEQEKEYQKTDISTEYLTDTDKIEIKNGLKVYGKENLSQIIEDYE